MGHCQNPEARFTDGSRKDLCICEDIVPCSSRQTVSCTDLHLKGHHEQKEHRQIPLREACNIRASPTATVSRWWRRGTLHALRLRAPMVDRRRSALAIGSGAPGVPVRVARAVCVHQDCLANVCSAKAVHSGLLKHCKNFSVRTCRRNQAAPAEPSQFRAFPGAPLRQLQSVFALHSGDSVFKRAVICSGFPWSPTSIEAPGIHSDVHGLNLVSTMWYRRCARTGM